MNRPLRIDWIAPPFAGHLLPMLAIARSLEERGIARGRFLSTPLYSDAVGAAGIEFVPVLDGLEREVLSFANAEGRFGSNPFVLLREFRRTIRFLAALQGDLRSEWTHGAPDLVIADSVLPCVGPVARAHDVRWWTSLASVPTLESPAAPPAYVGGWRPGRSALGGARDRVGRASVRAFKRAAYRIARRELRALGLTCVYRPDGSEACYSDETILGLGHPELEFADAWPAPLHLVGAPLATAHRCDAFPALESDRPHLLITLGTHLPWAKREALPEARRIAEALPDWTVHFSHGDGQGTLDRTTGNLRELSWVPYGPELSRYRSVLHHGGAGITYATLGAGVPALVRPRDFDQADFAARVEFAGFGLRVRGGVPDVLRKLRRLDALRPACERAAASMQQRDPASETAALLRRSFAGSG